ncbi:MAG: hypothetical protein EZS28_028611, partial [Streblomastix strix]
MRQANEKTLNERDRVIEERNRLQEELNRIQKELNRERQEKERAQVEKDQEQRRADTEHDEVIHLTAEITRLNQSLLQVTSSAQAITVNLEVPSGMHGLKDANRFTHDNTAASCVISTNPVISEGIVYYESVFENHEKYSFGIGIADSSVVFKPDNVPNDYEYNRKTVIYWNDSLVSLSSLSFSVLELELIILVTLVSIILFVFVGLVIWIVVVKGGVEGPHLLSKLSLYHYGYLVGLSAS